MTDDEINAMVHRIAPAFPTIYNTVPHGEVKAFAHAVIGQLAAPVQKNCPYCGTHEIELLRACHNSSCSGYATEESVYRGWEAAPKGDHK